MTLTADQDHTSNVYSKDGSLHVGTLTAEQYRRLRDEKVEPHLVRWSENTLIVDFGGRSGE